MSKTFNFELPLFSGFYESEYENSDTEYYAVQEEIEWYREDKDEEHGPEEFEFDYKRRRQDIVEAFCDAFNEICPDWVTEVKFDEIVSPKYYNFSTDRIFANVVFDDIWREQLLDFIKENYEELKTRIYEEWSNYDGFFSFMDNGIECWVEELKKEEPDSRYISNLLCYWLAKECNWSYGSVRESLYYLTMDNIYDSEYVSLREEKNDSK